MPPKRRHITISMPKGVAQKAGDVLQEVSVAAAADGDTQTASTAGAYSTYFTNAASTADGQACVGLGATLVAAGLLNSAAAEFDPPTGPKADATAKELEHAAEERKPC